MFSWSKYISKVSSNMHNYGYRDGQGSVLLLKVLVVLQIFKTKPSYTVESCYLQSLASHLPLTVTSTTAGKDKQISEGFTTNRKEVLRGKRALSVPLVLEIVGCTEQVALQILFSWNISSNYGVPLYFATVNPAFWHQGQHERMAERTWNTEQWEHIKIQITAVSNIQKDALPWKARW